MRLFLSPVGVHSRLSTAQNAYFQLKLWLHFKTEEHICSEQLDTCVLRVTTPSTVLVREQSVQFSEFSLISHRFIRQTLLSAINFVHELLLKTANRFG